VWQAVYSAGEYEGYPLPLFSPDSRLLALPNMHRDLVRVIEIATGREARRFDLQRHACSAAFSPDSRVLAVSADNSTIVVWDLTGRLKQGKLPQAELSANELDRHWQELAGEDAARACDVVWALAAAPRQSVPFIVKRDSPAAVPAAVLALIRDLDSDVFATRDQAWRALHELGDAADPALRAALKHAPSLEAKRRLERILNRASLPLASGEPLRGIRAVWVLEMAGTVEAEQHLRKLAGGVAGARLTREAEGALDRLRRRVRPYAG
jgi:hypothetical protein